MQIISRRLPRPYGRAGVELSRAARVRVQWMDYYRTRGRNAALTCRHFGISRQTFYRWQRRYDPHDLTRLEERSQATLAIGAREVLSSSCGQAG